MYLLIIRSLVLFLAISFTLIAVLLVGSYLAFLSHINHDENTLGGVKVSFTSTWVLYLVGVLWAAFYYLSQLS